MDSKSKSSQDFRSRLLKSCVESDTNTTCAFAGLQSHLEGKKKLHRRVCITVYLAQSSPVFTQCQHDTSD